MANGLEACNVLQQILKMNSLVEMGGFVSNAVVLSHSVVEIV